MSSIQQDNKVPSSPPVKTQIPDQPDAKGGTTSSPSSYERCTHKDRMEQEDLNLPVNYSEAILEIILEIMITSSIVSILTTLFPAFKNLVGVGLIVVLVIALTEVFLFLAKIRKPSEFIKKKLFIYLFLILGSTFLVTDAMDMMDTNDTIMAQFPLSCPAIPNPFSIYLSSSASTPHLFQSSVSSVPSAFHFHITSISSSETDVLMKYIFSITLLFATSFKACVLVFKVDLNELVL